jgi:hypothetical protein
MMAPDVLGDRDGVSLPHHKLRRGAGLRQQGRLHVIGGCLSSVAPLHPPAIGATAFNNSHQERRRVS